jgi:hypothetical protein
MQASSEIRIEVALEMKKAFELKNDLGEFGNMSTMVYDYMDYEGEDCFLCEDENDYQNKLNDFTSYMISEFGIASQLLKDYCKFYFEECVAVEIYYTNADNA